jgi:hypothetical protein
MAIGNIKIKIIIKPWAKPVIWLFAFFNMCPPKWTFRLVKV